MPNTKLDIQDEYESGGNTETTEVVEDSDVSDIETESIEESISNIEIFINQINNKIDEIKDQNEQDLLRTKIKNLQDEMRDKNQLDIDTLQQDLNEVYRIISEKYNKMEIPETNEDIEKWKNILLAPDVSFDTIQELNSIMNDQDKILLLRELSSLWLQTNDILILASCMEFDCWLLSLQTDNWNIDIPYITCPPPIWVISIINWEIFYWTDENMMFMNYINSNTNTNTSKSNLITSLSYKKKLSGTQYRDDGSQFNYYQQELTGKIGYIIKTPLNLKINPYIKAKATSNIWLTDIWDETRLNKQSTTVKSWFWTNISYTGSLWWKYDFSVYGWMYQNLLNLSWWTLKWKPSTTLTLWWNFYLPNNRSLWWEINYSSSWIVEYNANVSKKIWDTASIFWKFSHSVWGWSSNPEWSIWFTLKF